MDYETKKSSKINRNSLINQKQSQGCMVFLTVSYIENFSVQVVCKDFIASPKNLDIFSVLTIATGSPSATAACAVCKTVQCSKSTKEESFALSCDIFAQEIRPLRFCTVNCSLELTLHLPWRTVLSAVCNLIIYHPSHYHL